MTICVNCKKKEATKVFNMIVKVMDLCDVCYVAVQRYVWLDRILSDDFNCSASGCLEPWSDEQIKIFLEKNFPYPK